MPTAKIAEALEEIREGKIVILVDDEDRENEGDLCMAAQFVTPEAINFMAKYGRGLVCLTLSEEQAEKLNLLNREMMMEVLSQANAPLAAFSGYGLTIRSPEISEISSGDWNELRSVLETNYTKYGEIPNFGQAHTTLELLGRIPKP